MTSIIEKTLPVTDDEAAFLHAQGWQSGYGWERGLDWFWKPSMGDPIWIEDDPEKLNLWLADRQEHARAILKRRAEGAAMDMLEALERLLPIADGSAPCVGSDYELALDLARSVRARVRNNKEQSQ